MFKLNSKPKDILKFCTEINPFDFILCCCFLIYHISIETEPWRDFCIVVVAAIWCNRFYETN